MSKTIFVISDLHLGGEPGFQICSPTGQERLAQFICWAEQQRTKDNDIHLVIAGDVVDFLAEEEFQAFTMNDKQAARKLENVFKNFAGVWNALRCFIASGAALTLMLGNHDIELSLPAPFRMLREKLGPGRVEFIFDNQAFVEGPVLIEHGNRYDMWNVVPHDNLRQIRSALSRRETLPDWSPIPGSQLVFSVMNKLKSKYKFIDLLKPETDAAIPLLVVLEPKAIKDLPDFAALLRMANETRFDAQGRPKDLGQMGGTRNRAREAAQQRGAAQASQPPLFPEKEKFQRILAQAKELAEVKDLGQMTSVKETLGSFLNLLRAAATKDRERLIDRLYRALRILAEEQHLSYDPTYEDEIYLTPARAMVNQGFQVIVFGHTHLPKRVKLNQHQNTPLSILRREDDFPLYLNSGTWADIIRLPASLFKNDEKAAKAELNLFAYDMEKSELANWRQPVASYVQIELDGEQIKQAQVHHFESAENPAVLPTC